MRIYANGKIVDKDNPLPVSGSFVDANGNPLFSSSNPGNVQLSGSSATQAVAVTPNDSDDLAGGATKGLYLGGTGNVKVDMADGSTVTFVGLAGGVIHPLSVKRVYQTDTTASNIVAVY